jgi:hypothetical protein
VALVIPPAMDVDDRCHATTFTCLGSTRIQDAASSVLTLCLYQEGRSVVSARAHMSAASSGRITSVSTRWSTAALYLANQAA